jgi:DNA-binding transcriptional LysR family regulator
MRVDFLGLQAFLTIAERRSFQRAAAHLNLSQTALSHRMRKLEDDLCVKLLVRAGREVTLTSEGVDLLPKARRSIADIEASLDALRLRRDAQQTRLAIGCLPTVATAHLPSILKQFAARQCGALLRVHDNSASEIAALVQSGAVEFAITNLSANDCDLETETLIRESFVLICPAGHPLAIAKIAEWGSLAGQAMIRVSKETANRVLIDETLGSRRELLDWRYEVQRTATAVGMVRAGIGLTILPALAADPRAMPGLAVVALRNPGITRSLGILSRKSAPLSPLAQELRGIVQRYFLDLGAVSAEKGQRACVA